MRNTVEGILDSMFAGTASGRTPKEIRYKNWAMNILGVWMVVTMLSMFYMNDFVSFTAIALGTFGMTCPRLIKRTTFRGIVVLMIASFWYDLFFLCVLHDPTAEDAQMSMQAVNVRRFAYFFAWINLALRPVVIVVFWLISLQFFTVVKQKTGQQQQKNEMQGIMARYANYYP